MGLKAAEKFPNDFDGIVAGAPAVDFNNLYSWRASFFPITSPIGSPDFITATMWSGLIHDAILAQCDHLDGVIDGIMCVLLPHIPISPSPKLPSSNCTTRSQTPPTP